MDGYSNSMLRQAGRVVLTLFLLFGLGRPTLVGQSFQNELFAPSIKTLTVANSGGWDLPPAIELGAGDWLEFSFDELTEYANYFNYSVVHCNADWTQSDLSEIDYLDGFNNNPLEQQEPSFNTYQPYHHYRLTLPNDKVKLKLSGNYALRIFRANNPADVVATACFYVVENLVGVYPQVVADTDVSFREAYQQVNVRVHAPNYEIRTPQTDLKLVVQQNSRSDTRRTVSAPLHQRQDELVYEHNQDLIFEAGNEYRRFEIVSSKYPGLNVDFIRHQNDRYVAVLFPDASRNGKTYQYDQDQNGRLLVRSVEASDSEVEADYFRVRFAFPATLPFLNGKLYLMGELTQNRIQPMYELTYDTAEQHYALELLLKQGAYNYQYVVVPNENRLPTLSLTEGCYWETENEYFATLYHRPPGGRYDRLIGMAHVRSK